MHFCCGQLVITRQQQNDMYIGKTVFFSNMEIDFTLVTILAFVTVCSLIVRSGKGYHWPGIF